MNKLLLYATGNFSVFQNFLKAHFFVIRKTSLLQKVIVIEPNEVPLLSSNMKIR